VSGAAPGVEWGGTVHSLARAGWIRLAPRTATATGTGSSLCTIRRMTDDPVDPVAVSWARIDAWLAAYAPASFTQLAPPATVAEIDAAEMVIGQPFPADLRESLLCHNGVQGGVSTAFPPYETPRSVDEIVAIWQSNMDTKLVEEGWVDEHFGEPWWHPCWFAWAETDNEKLIIDNRPGPAQGRTGWHLHDSGAVLNGWPSLAHYLNEVAEALYRTGVVGDNRPFLTSFDLDDEDFADDVELTWSEDEDEDDARRPAPIGPPPGTSADG
jgi:cell wall assembly regulator SMI1